MTAEHHPVDGGDHMALFEELAHQMAANVAVGSGNQDMRHVVRPLSLPD
jgi:hypothetical protein